MSPTHRRPRLGVPSSILLLCAWLLALSGSTAAAQQPARLSAGDSVRVDGQIVGRVLNIEGTTMVVISREAPRCRAGQAHGEASICDPAPLVRHEMELGAVRIERRMAKPDLTLRLLGGGVLGAAAFGTAGWLFGPSIGFGRVEGCAESGSNNGCATGEPRYTVEKLESLQKASDQKRGALFFGVIGGTATAVLVSKLSRGWVRVEPVLAAGPEDSWGLHVSLPAPR